MSVQDRRRTESVDPDEPPILISHFFHAFQAYLPIIVISMGAVAVAYMIVAVALYLMGPNQRTTTQNFRLDFEGVATGHYPNGLKFNPVDIVSTPILLKAFQENDLSRFTNFANFSRSVFILEANPEYEKLASEYQARLADPKLSPVDRERIEREWETKRQSIAKNDYSLNYSRRLNATVIPESVVRKLLTDILTDWARYAVSEQHVLDYRLGVVSPQILNAPPFDNDNLIVSLQVLRSQVNRVLENVDELSAIPGADLIRTADDRASLDEIRLRLEQILRFRLEPLVSIVRSSGLDPNPGATVRFLESQLAYDQRRLQALQQRADSIKAALAAYSNQQQAPAPPTEITTAEGTKPRTSATPSETIMPQLSDTFIDRIAALTKQASDQEYRQKMVEEFRNAGAAVIPAQLAVTYDEQVLKLMRSSPVGGSGGNPQRVRAEIDASRAETKQLLVKVNQIYQILSKNLSPSAELFTMTQAPTTRTEHSRTPQMLVTYGILVLLIAFPLIVVGCLLHHRMRVEEAAEEDYRVTHVGVP